MVAGTQFTGFSQERHAQFADGHPWQIDTRSGSVRRHWKVLAIVASVTLAGLAIVAASSTSKASQAAGPLGVRGACAVLIDHPQTLQEMQTLRAERLKAWHTRLEKYGGDGQGGPARMALQQVRTEHHSAMPALLAKDGITVPEGAGPARSYGMVLGRGACRGQGAPQTSGGACH